MSAVLIGATVLASLMASLLPVLHSFLPAARRRRRLLNTQMADQRFQQWLDHYNQQANLQIQQQQVLSNLRRLAARLSRLPDDA